MRVASLVLLLAVALSAQAPQAAPGQAAQAPAAKGSVAGKVVNALTGEPLRKAAVVLARTDGPGQAQSSITDEQGQFLFRSVDAGRYRMFANRTGYVRQAYGQRDPGSYLDVGGGTLVVTAGQEVKDLLFRLLPAGAISGRVVDEDGEPMMGVQVQALRWGYFRGRRQMMPSGSDQSNDRGEYRIFNLAPGRYYLSATYEGGYVSAYLTGFNRGNSDAAPDESYAPSFYPGTSDGSQAAPVELRGGDDVGGINFMLAPQRAVRVSGRVFNSVTGQPGRNVHVAVIARSLTLRAFVSGDHDATTDEQGVFHIRGVPPGSYMAVAEWDGEGQGPGTTITDNDGRRTVQYSRRHYSARQALEVGSADVDGVNLVIAPGTDVSGSVRIEGTLPKPSAEERNIRVGNRMMVVTGGNQMRVMLEPTDDLSIGNLGATIRPDNSFVINNVPDDTYRVNVAGLPEGAYLKSAKFAGQDVFEDGLVMTRGRRASLDLVISASAGALSGTVVDSGHKPYVGARVALVPEGAGRKRPTLFRSATSDQYGRFSIRSVPPGDYKLFAWDMIEPGAYQDPEFLRPYEDRGQLVRVTEGVQSTAELEVIVTATGAQ